MTISALVTVRRIIVIFISNTTQDSRASQLYYTFVLFTSSGLSVLFLVLAIVNSALDNNVINNPRLLLNGISIIWMALEEHIFVKVKPLSYFC